MDAAGPGSDEAWGVTLASFAARRVTGELVVSPGDKEIRVAFRNGAIVGATSPSMQDSPVRVAVQLSLLTTSQVSDIARRQKAAPQRDEIELIAEVAKLSGDQVRRLRRRTVALRAARTFAITTGYKFVNTITMPIMPGNELDVRAVIYIGARVHLSADRISPDLQKLTWDMTPQQVEDLPQFGFNAPEMTIVTGLRAGMSLTDIVGMNAEVDPRMAQALLYTLVACYAPETMPIMAPPPSQFEEFAERIDLKELDGGGSVSFRSKPTSVPPVRPTPSPTGRLPARPTPIPRSPSSSSPPGASTGTTIPPRAATPSGPPVRPTPNPTAPNALRSTGSQPRIARPSSAQPGSPSASQSQPALPRTTTAEKTIDEQRAEADEAFKRGEMALRREQLKEAMGEFVKAVELAPGNGAYLGALAWTKFCQATDKEAVAAEVRTALARAIFATEQCTPRLYLGRVERMLGRDREALAHFQQVLMEVPGHTEARSEVRVLEQRIAADRTKRPTKS